MGVIKKQYINGYFYISNRFIRELGKSLTVHQKLVYISLVSHCNKDGITYISGRTVAKELGISKNTAYASFKKLEKTGWLKDKHPNGGHEYRQIMNVQEKVALSQSEKNLSQNDTSLSQSVRTKEYIKEYNKGIFLNSKNNNSFTSLAEIINKKPSNTT